MNNQKANRNLFTFGAFPKRLRLALTLGILLAAAFGLVMFRAQASAGSAGIFNQAKMFLSGNAPADTFQPDKQPTSPLASVTTNGGSGLDATYPDLAAAITALNAASITSPVVITANGTETAPAGGYTITATGTSANTIIIDGGGATTITAFTPQASGILHDAIFEIVGGDFITITGFTMLENAANTTTAAGTNNMTEWGVALHYATTTNGAQNNTVQNNTITLNRTYQNTWGIYSNSTHSATAVTTSATATTAAGGNSGLKIYGNTISNVNQGINVIGPTAAADMNTGVDIGGTGGAQANSITNWGTTGTFSGYANVSGTLNCILVRNSIGFNVSFNTLTSSVGGNTVTTSERAIYVPSFSIAPTGTFTNTINSNNISVQSGFATGTLNGIINEATTGTATSSLTISSNNFNTFGHTVAASGATTFINSTMAHLNTTINSNTFTNITLPSTGSVTFISNSITIPANGSQTINGNSIVTAFNKTGAGGTVTLFTNNGSSPATVTEQNNNNNFSNITVTGATTIAGWSSTDGGSPTKTVTGNTFSNWTGGTSAMTGLTVSFSGASNISSNTISNFTGASTITGLSSGSGIETISQNTIHTLTGTGTGTVTGINNTGGTTKLISRNKVYNLENSNAGGVASGITVSSGTTVNVQNNLVGDIRTPALNAANSLFGINISGGTTVNADFNSVYLNATSSGALFGSSALNASSTPTFTMRNNVLVNLSTVAGAGLAVAYRRSSATLTTYQSASNNNDFFASTIYTDGTTPQTTIGAYQTLVAPRDAASVSENPPFLSTTGSSAMFLHISLVTPTFLESGGATVAGITTDFDGDTRAATPDIGADEFAGMSAGDSAPPSITYTTLTNTGSTANRTLVATITDATGVGTGGGAPLIYYRKGNSGAYTSAVATSIAGNDYTFTIDYAAVGGVVGGDTIQYYVAAQDTASTPNVATNPIGGSGINPPGSTAPGAPNSYNILFVISTFPYTQDFESGAGGFTSAIVGGSVNDWVLGTPAKTSIAGARSGANAWVTKTTGTYSSSHNAAVVSPIFNFSALTTDPTFSFWHNFDQDNDAGFDAGVLEVSTDGGTTFTKVDANLGTGATFNTTNSTFWYNSSSASGPVTPPKFSGISTAYTGHAAGYIQSTTLLVGMAGQADVRLRWRFGSDGSDVDEGWAVDDVAVQVIAPNPGMVQFSSTAFAGSEGAMATITATRTGGNAGAISVDYATSNGTATAGTCGAGGDYMAASGTLNWADLDVASKTFTVTLCSDAVLDAAETVNLTLSNPTGGATIGTNNPAVLTITDVPPPLAGNFNVPGDFPSLTNAGGIFDAMNTSGVAGTITINIAADLTGENGGIALNENAGAFAVTIKPSGVPPRTITGSNTTNGIIRLNGADNVTLNGSTTASFGEIVGGDAALRELTVTNTSTSTSSAVIVVQSGTNGAQNNTIKNVNVRGNDPTQTLIGISLGGATPGVIGTDNDGNRVENCSVQKTLFGIYSAGASLANQNTGTVITMNDLTGTGANRIRRVGIVVFNENGVQITENSVGGIDTTESADAVGIGVGTQSVDTTNTTSGGVTNALVTRNKVNGVAITGTSDFSVAGIAVSGAVGGANTLSNNMVSGVIGQATSPDIIAGIYIVGATGSSTRLFHNSVSLTGDRGSLADQLPSYGVAITGPDPTVELKNNIFYNTQISSIVNAKSYTIGMVTTTFTNLDSDFNDFFSSGANAGFFRSGSLAAAAGTDYATLALWRTAVADDANSQEVDPVYVDPANDLHLQSATSPLLGDGATVASVTNDFDADPRPATMPDIGADEVVQAQGGSVPAGTYYNALLGGTLAGNVTVTNSLTLTGILNTGSNTLTMGCNTTVSGASGSNYVIGNLARMYCAAGSFSFPVGTTPPPMFGEAPAGLPTNYSPVTVNFTSLTTLPSTVTVKANVGRIVGTTNANTINRYWDITNTAVAGTYLANLGFTYVPGVDDVDYTGNGAAPIFNRIIRYENTSGIFTNFPANETGGGNPLTVNGINAFSQWGIGGNPNAPTLAVVKNHEGYRFNDGNLVRWQSSFEQDNLGFRVLRLRNADCGLRNGNCLEEITPNLIAGSALMTGKTPLASGKSYSWWDANGAPGSIYYVEDVDLNGKTTLHGPITLRDEGRGMRDEVRSSPLLNELRPAGNGTGLIEQQVLPRELRQSATGGDSAIRNPHSAIGRPEPGSDAFATQLALAGRNAVKLGVRQNGWYRVAGAQLQAAGLPANADARFLQLYVNGAQVPIAIRTSTGGDAGALGDTGVMEFYGLANDTRESDTATYWLIVGDTPGLRFGQPVRVAPGGGDAEGGSGSGISNSASGIPGSEVPNTKYQNATGSFAYTVERKDRTIYVPAIHNGDTENFFGAIISNTEGSQTLRVGKPAVNASEPASLSVALQGATEGEHQVAVSLNGRQVGVMSFDGQERKVSRFSVSQTALAEGDNTVTLRSLNGASDVSVTDYLRLTYQHRYEADDNRLLFATGNRNGARVTGFTANNVRVFDLTDAGRYFEVAARTEADGNGYAVNIPSRLNGRQLLAIADNQALSPVSIAANEPSSWTRAENEADFIILAPRAFREAGNSLAAFRRQQQGLRVSVVNLEDVFDEWSGGAKDVNALRGFLRYAREKWNVGPQYVLFMGDASLDPRNYLGYGDTDLLPTAYVDTPDLETSSDEALVDFDNDGVGEMSVGRWPVRTLAQAQTLVYRATVAQPATGNRRAVFVADQTQTYNFEQMNQDARGLLPSEMPVTFINRNGQSDATVRSQIVSAINEGPALVQYAGHGSQDVWTGGPIFNGGDANGLTNGAERLPLFVTMTCLNGYFHNLGADSLAESLMRAPNGGALAVWASSSLTFPEDQAAMNRAFIQAAYSGNGMRLGDAARQAKSATGNQTVRRTWILFGDPTARLR